MEWQEHAGDFEDENIEFRRDVLKYFQDSPSQFSIDLVAALYDAETSFAKEAWGVNQVVSLLAQELLERGGSKYASIYLQGWARGMDAHIQSKQIELSTERIQELIQYAKSRSEDDEFPNKSAADLFIEFLEYKLAEKH